MFYTKCRTKSRIPSHLQYRSKYPALLDYWLLLWLMITKWFKLKYKTIPQIIYQNISRTTTTSDKLCRNWIFLYLFQSVKFRTKFWFCKHKKIKSIQKMNYNLNFCVRTLIAMLFENGTVKWFILQDVYVDTNLDSSQ